MNMLLWVLLNILPFIWVAAFIYLLYKGKRASYFNGLLFFTLVNLIHWYVDHSVNPFASEFYISSPSQFALGAISGLFGMALTCQYKSRAIIFKNVVLIFCATLPPIYSVAVFSVHRGAMAKIEKMNFESKTREYTLLINRARFPKSNKDREIDQTFTADVIRMAPYQNAIMNYKAELKAKKAMSEETLFKEYLLKHRWETRPVIANDLTSKYESCMSSVCLKKKECTKEVTDYPAPVNGYVAFLNRNQNYDCGNLIKNSIELCFKNDMTSCRNIYGVLFSEVRDVTIEFLANRPEIAILKNSIGHKICELGDLAYCYENALNKSVSDARQDFSVLCEKNYAMGCFALGVLNWNSDPKARNGLLGQACKLQIEICDKILLFAEMHRDESVFKHFSAKRHQED